MSELRNSQWRDSNDRVKYPFADEVSLSNDSVIVPDTLFADARLYPIGGSEKQFVSSIVKLGRAISFTVSDQSGTELAYGTYDGDNPPTRNVIAVTDKFGRAAGVLVTSTTRMAPLLGWADGTYEFTQQQTLFSAGVAVPMPGSGVTSLRADETTALAGHAVLVGGRGVILTVSGSTIYAHAAGEPKYKQMLCGENGFSYLCPVKTINGLRPDKYGNFDIVPCGMATEQSPIRVTPLEHGIKIDVASGS